MKKKFLLVLSLMALVACGGNTSDTSLASSESSSSSSDSEDDNGWRSEQKELMQLYLYDEVLPYYDFGVGTSVQYLAQYTELQIIGTNSINQDVLKEYASLLLANNWYESRDQYSDLPENIYVFQKKIATSYGNRFVDIQFYARDEEKQVADEGTFALGAFDHHEYNFPTEMFNQAIKKNTSSNLTVPVFPADYYTLIKGYAEVLCITSDTKAETTYQSILKDANYEISFEKNSAGYYVAVAPDKQFAVGYRYDEKFKALDIALARVPKSALTTSEWPTSGLQNAFNLYQQSEFEVPEMKFEGAKYYGAEDSNNQWYVVLNIPQEINYSIEVYGATEDSLTTYENTLTEKGWKYDLSATWEIGGGLKVYRKSLDNNKLAQIGIILDKNSNIATIHVYLFLQDAPLKQWPKEQVDASIKNLKYIRDRVPEFSNEKVTGYLLRRKFEYGLPIYYVEMYCDDHDVEEILKAYVKTLTDAKWTAKDSTTKENDYLSPNKELLVEVDKKISSVTILFKEEPLESWPTDFVNKQKEANSYSDELPAVTGEAICFTYDDSPVTASPGSYEIDVSLTGFSNKTAITKVMEDYEKTLSEKSFKSLDKDDPDIKDEKFYSSPNEQFEVKMWVKSTYKTLVILVTPIAKK